MSQHGVHGRPSRASLGLFTNGRWNSRRGTARAMNQEGMMGRPKSSSTSASTPRSVGARDAVTYVRVSSKEQEREGFSIPAQRKLLQAYADEHGIQIVQEFEDI